jgi:hypothetical protein
MKYRIKETKLSDGAVIFTPQIKYKFCPFWTNISIFNFVSHEFALDFIKRYNETYTKKNNKVCDIKYHDVTIEVFK